MIVSVYRIRVDGTSMIAIDMKQLTRGQFLDRQIHRYGTRLEGMELISTRDSRDAEPSMISLRKGNA